MVTLSFRGLMAPVFTPFNDDFTINLEVIPGYLRHLKEKNINGILVNGSSGEGMSLNVDERILLTEVWTKEAHKRGMHVMVQVGGAPLPDVIALAKHAESVQVDSILALPELYFKPKSISELVDYLAIIGKAAPETPLLYYHIPKNTDVTFNMASMVTEAKKHIKTFRGLKFTSIDLVEGAATLKACGNDCTIFLGADKLLAPSMILGFDSAIGTSFNMLPSMTTKMLEIMQGNLGVRAGIKGAGLLQNQLSTAIDTIAQFGDWVPTMKAAMELITGIEVGPPRRPIVSLTEEEKKQMGKELKEQGIKLYADYSK